MILDGKMLAGFIQTRQLQQMRSLHSRGAQPRLVIVKTTEDPATNSYIKIKQQYGDEIGVTVDVAMVESDTIEDRINQLNADDSVHGIIVQLPLAEGIDEESVLARVDTKKDVDGLSANTDFEPPTPTAILWLLAGFNIDTGGKSIAVVGKGRLVGAPLADTLVRDGHDVTVYTSKDADRLGSRLLKHDLIITGVGEPGLISSEMISAGAVVIDAGTALSEGRLVGDVDRAVYERDDIKISPVPGGVGPLTVCALFENLLRAVSEQISN